MSQRPRLELPPGPARITGRVVASGPLLRAPASGRPCVFYQVIGRNHVWPWHDRRCYPRGEVAFWIDDGAGQVRIVVPAPPSPAPAESLECSLAGEAFRRTIYEGESPETDRLLDPGGYPFRLDSYLHAEERIVVAGDVLTVAGESVEEIDLAGQAPNFRSPPTRLILRARSLRSPA